MRFIIILFLPIFLSAHKVNLFLDLKDENLYINSYFANAKPCINCKFKIEVEKEPDFEDILDKNGEYNYKISKNDLKVTIDAGSGHLVSKEIKTSTLIEKDQENSRVKNSKELEQLIEENSILKHRIEVLEEQLNYFEFLKIAFGLFLIFLIFILIKRFKT
ncbi:hypothetical protein CRU87_03515 [Aliarcobacter trophiarum LMG 25534]|uniref:Cobalt/nickel ECF transporter CbiMNQO, S component CbiN n=1 Tax=Aliarcobacter trophiarum LMG 25534 TaxID=1032241 RepID=A0AAD0QL62_9BACT|nr:hypothetical protein [Aliarcobacter trophiarum]AXK49721.1 cobalt/nickel ECF transporter CbiMNQO, S component CbiN [Aliarcobacter trophiarum LMG 25534]RXI28045.1 hypothetical protein CRU89_02340 [Aliarcobacter trophiarum]RXJ92501.1 hypothetical protein CRU87_03515 [Aliarcobacter trophiarum LMG 25534]